MIQQGSKFAAPVAKPQDRLSIGIVFALWAWAIASLVYGFMPTASHTRIVLPASAAIWAVGASALALRRPRLLIWITPTALLALLTLLTWFDVMQCPSDMEWCSRFGG